MPWRGYNFEDAILVSERLVKDDYYTSIHIEELEIEARDTKLGPEEITRDIPNVGENMLRDLDEIGHHPHRRAGQAGLDPRRQGHAEGRDAVDRRRETAPRHLRREGRRREGRIARPARRASTARSSTCRSSRARVRSKDERSLDIEQEEEDRLRRDLEDEIRILREQRDERIYELFEGRKLAEDLLVEREVRIPRRRDASRARCSPASSRSALRKARGCGARASTSPPRSRSTKSAPSARSTFCPTSTTRRSPSSSRATNLPPGVIKMVKVFIAMKRKLSVGDKMAGRHGNKGVIARILPEEDMPYLPDGTPVEIVLNPLGVPSRMNVGQILETHLGWAARVLGLHFATPVFDGASETEIKGMIKRAGDKLREQGLPDIVGESGKTRPLRRTDGRAVRAEGDRRLHLHAQALAPGGRQDSRALDRAVLA